MSSVNSWFLTRKLGEVWVRISIYGLLGLGTAVIAALVAPLVPALETGSVDRETVSVLLQILSSSMLAVTTFSVSIMIAARTAASGGATPRVTALLKTDTTSQQILATFVGAFVYSLVSIIGLQLSFYGAGGRLVLLVATIGVLVTVVVQLVRWISHLGDFGRLADTVSRVEVAATSALVDRLNDPFMGGRPLDASFQDQLSGGQKIFASATGYVQMIDMSRLNALADGAGVLLAITALPGAFVHPGHYIAVVLSPGRLSPDDASMLCGCFAIGPTRTFEQDPRFGVMTLTEIASRALSPAVNDPGTAIDILGRHLRVLSHWSEACTPELRFRSVLVQGLDLRDVVSDAFDPVARDGAGLVEVQVRLQKMLIGLVRQAPDVFGAGAREISQRSVGHACAAMVLEDDKRAVSDLAKVLDVMLGLDATALDVAADGPTMTV